MEVGIRIFGGISLLILVLISSGLNLMLLIVLIRGHHEFKKSSFFILTWQLLICDLLALCAQLFLAAPTTIAGFQIYPEFLVLSLSIFDRFSYNGTLIFAFILTLNRFMVFLIPKINKILFSQPFIYFTVGFGWAILLLYIISTSIGGCYSKFDGITNFRFIHKCIPAELRPWWSSEIVGAINNWCSQFIPWIMLLLYLLTFVEIRFKITQKLFNNDSTVNLFSTKTRKNTEMRLLNQSLIICSVFVIEYYSFRYLPEIAKGNAFFESFDSILISWIMVAMNTIHSIVVFTFTKRARILLKDLFRFSRTAPFSTTPFIARISPR